MANGTAGQFDKALAVQQHQYRVPAYPGHGGRRGLPAQTVHGTPQSPQLPASLAHAVLAILGLTNYQSFVSNAVHADQQILQPRSSSTSQCVAETGLPKACNTPADFASDYNLDGLYRRGALGQGADRRHRHARRARSRRAPILLEERPGHEAERAHRDCHQRRRRARRSQRRERER